MFWMIFSVFQKIWVFGYSLSTLLWYQCYYPLLSCLLSLKNLPKKKEMKTKKKTLWNLAKTNGWEVYKDISDEFADKIEKIVKDKNLTIQEVFDKFDKLHDKIKYKAFGKVTICEKKDIKYDKNITLMKITLLMKKLQNVCLKNKGILLKKSWNR